MKKVIITKGLPASGKSTWAKKMIAENPNAYKRVNKDDLRAMLDDSRHGKDSENFVLKVRDLLIIEALKDGKHVIVDDTNFAPKHEARITQLVKEYCKANNDKAEVIVREFDTDIDTCIKRDLERQRSVGESVIRKMWKQYLAPQPETVEYTAGLPDAIICDLDGTLCLLNGRNPYDASTCEQDLCNPVVLDILRTMAMPSDTLLFVSGRQDRWCDQTVAWLDKHVSRDYMLYMRATDDMRKDSIIKEEIYRNKIQGQYNVRFVLDDRNQVVEMWRRMGLVCLQVADGDF